MRRDQTASLRSSRSKSRALLSTVFADRGGNNSLNHAQVVQLDSSDGIASIEGRVSRRDVDVYRLSPTATGNLQLTLTDVGRKPVHFDVMTADGQRLLQQTVHNGSSTGTVAVTAGQDVYFRVRAPGRGAAAVSNQARRAGRCRPFDHPSQHESARFRPDHDRNRHRGRSLRERSISPKPRRFSHGPHTGFFRSRPVLRHDRRERQFRCLPTDRAPVGTPHVQHSTDGIIPGHVDRHRFVGEATAQARFRHPVIRGVLPGPAGPDLHDHDRGARGDAGARY